MASSSVPSVRTRVHFRFRFSALHGLQILIFHPWISHRLPHVMWFRQNLLGSTATGTIAPSKMRAGHTCVHQQQRGPSVVLHLSHQVNIAPLSDFFYIWPKQTLRPPIKLLCLSSPTHHHQALLPFHYSSPMCLSKTAVSGCTSVWLISKSFRKTHREVAHAGALSHFHILLSWDQAGEAG